MRRLTLLLVLASSRCQRAAPPELQVHREDGFVDLQLGARRLEGDGPITYRIQARQGARRLGFDVALLGPWKEQADPAFTVRWGQVELRSVGAPSDAFLELLGRQYGHEVSGRMSPTVRVHAVALEGNPERRREALKLKLFFEGPSATQAPDGGVDDDDDADASGDSYGEVYLNVDPALRQACWCEKDPEYRKGVLGGLTR